MSRFPDTVEICEVGPRDGLQNEHPIPIGQRVQLIEALSATGLRQIEAVSFVSPEAIPPMAGAEEVMARIRRVPGVTYRALVPNEQGAERAITAKANELEFVVSASETHNQRNVRQSVDESIDGAKSIIAMAHGAGIRVDGIVSTAFGCPYEGDIEPTAVAAAAARLLEAGADSVSFGDTTGMATPKRVDALLDELDWAGVESRKVGLHFHNTRGTGLANVLMGLTRGVRRFDASIGGLGGCPYAPGATGNVVTEDLVHMLEDMEITTGVDLQALIDVAHLAQEMVGRDLPGQVMRSGPRTRREDGGAA
jgi:hydroxymethylglutaryl-CoA lyase